LIVVGGGGWSGLISESPGTAAWVVFIRVPSIGLSQSVAVVLCSQFSVLISGGDGAISDSDTHTNTQHVAGGSATDRQLRKLTTGCVRVAVRVVQTTQPTVNGDQSDEDDYSFRS